MSRDRVIQVDGNSWRITGRLVFAGSFTPPGDKSLAHRAFLLAALSCGRCNLANLPDAEDVQRTRGALEALGVRTEPQLGSYAVHGVGLRGLRPAGSVIDCGNSGTTMRLLAGILAMQRFASELQGDASLSRRPMQRVASPLRAMGARITCRGAGARPPLRIEPATDGRLVGITHHLKVDSAQVRSAILLAGLGAEGVTTLRPASASRDHTERMLGALGVNVERGPEGTTLQPAPATWEGFDFDVPGDLSALAFFAARASKDAGLRARRVGQNPGRLRFVEILRDAGVRVELREQRSTLGESVGTLALGGRPQGALRIAGDDVVRCIDEIPALLAGAAAAGVAASVEGAAELRNKESDRIASMAEVLRAFGAVVHDSSDGLRIEAQTPLRPAHVHAYGDHRIAMAAAILAAAAEGTSVVDGVDCVRTSYPAFANDFAHLAHPD